MSLSPDFIAELGKHFDGEIRNDAATRVLYSTDASIYQIEPLGVALPRTQDDLIASVELAAKYRIPILPRGSGSSLAGQAIGQALILDCSRYLDRIISIDPESHTAKVEPGVVLATLNRAAAKHGLVFGPDPASAERATLGGVIGNNATGAHSIRYGMTADHLLAADVILADGSIATWQDVAVSTAVRQPSALMAAALAIREEYAGAIRAGWPKAWRNSAGYRLNYLLPWSASRPPHWTEGIYPPIAPDHINLAPLLAGSEGTLAVVRTATVNLVSLPKHTILGVLFYASIRQACDDVPRLLGYHPSAVELIPQMLIRLARTVPAAAGRLGFVRNDAGQDPAALLVVEFSGDDPAALRAQVRQLGPGVLVAESAAEQANVWSVRNIGLGIFDSRPGSARPVAFIEDCAIPVERLGEFVSEVERILAAHGTEAAFYAHASAGTLHIRPILDLKTGEGLRALRTIAEAVLALALRLGGVMSSEHGDGLARAEWLKQTYGESIFTAFRQLKQAADPHALLNPHKLTDAPPMDTHLRYRPDSRLQAWVPALDFSHQGGLALAVEQCNGQGVCRKLSLSGVEGGGGVMCPSFQATRDEQNSTRGRANLLRAMLTFGDKGLRAEQAWPALDLCLACKGCKAECPSGVDMAKLKFEFMNEYYKTRPRPLRDYLFGYFHVVAGVLASIAPLANVAMQNPLLKGLAARVFHLTAQRPFPRFSWRKARAHLRQSRPAVLFLTDAFTHHIEPDVEQAAFDLLDLAGFDVKVVPVSGAGASLLSKGLVGAARRHATQVLAALKRLDPQFSLPVVGIEPPELYSLKNDYADLLPGRRDEIAQRVRNTWLLDEFLLHSDACEKWRALDLHMGQVKFQPHCHQRAEGPSAGPNGVNATVALLQACGYEVDVLDSGCCGMAGTFGYDAEHYALSMQVGALQVFPQVEAAGDALIASSGAACRMQIEQGTSVRAEHPLVLAARALLRSRSL